MKKILLGFLMIAAIGIVSCSVGSRNTLQSGQFDAETQERFIGHVFLD